MSAESSCAQELYGEIKDPAKMTNAKIDLVKRGLGAKRAHAKSQSVKMMVGRVCVQAGALGRCVCTRAAQRTLSRLVEARISKFRDLRERESNAAPPGSCTRRPPARG